MPIRLTYSRDDSVVVPPQIGACAELHGLRDDGRCPEDSTSLLSKVSFLGTDDYVGPTIGNRGPRCLPLHCLYAYYGALFLKVNRESTNRFVR